MKLWLIGGTIVGLLVVSFYLAAVKRSAPATPDAAIVVAEEPKPAPPLPLALQDVVDVTNIEPLLDPPAIPIAEPSVAGPILTRVGYEEVVPTEQPSIDVEPIPKAKEEIAIRAEEETTKTEP